MKSKLGACGKERPPEHLRDRLADRLGRRLAHDFRSSNRRQKLIFEEILLSYEEREKIDEKLLSDFEQSLEEAHANARDLIGILRGAN